jgi:hypothetical protein
VSGPPTSLGTRCILDVYFSEGLSIRLELKRFWKRRERTDKEISVENFQVDYPLAARCGSSILNICRPTYQLSVAIPSHLVDPILPDRVQWCLKVSIHLKNDHASVRIPALVTASLGLPRKFIYRARPLIQKILSISYIGVFQLQVSTWEAERDKT